MKIFSVIVLPVLLVGIAFIGWYRWDSARNRGREFGYYGEFNRVSNALASVPNVTISEGWYNGDVTLEEFGFSMTVTGKSIRLLFNETDPIRNLSRDATVSALRKLIDAELANPTK